MSQGIALVAVGLVALWLWRRRAGRRSMEAQETIAEVAEGIGPPPGRSRILIPGLSRFQPAHVPPGLTWCAVCQTGQLTRRPNTEYTLVVICPGCRPGELEAAG